ncbi:TonB-dependent receptor [Dyella psychrodurans]|uniref:TonB-dependent receptor n=1 Tax=Dyella psychrodurans TaxID=1927960 RepID=A0A370WVA6_9GAMM|nr:TonB-dependent receptor [Dyella psychrodurans]RDS80062.1 TonB-dependent receptor [Dyella psychrodurans]
MKINPITCAVLAALAVSRVSYADGTTPPAPVAQPNQTVAQSSQPAQSGPSANAADPANAANASTLGTVTVTAQHTVQDIQDVPITIQAFTGNTLQQLNVTSFDDLIKYLPNVTFAANGPGQGNIYMRGLSTGFLGNQSSATIAPFPNVAVYLDDQSMQFPARNLDVYMVDMERVEVLEGPQGTLFGGGAEAGVVRYITNKPNLDKVSGSAEASVGVTDGGAPNNSANAVLNLPIIPGTFAVRGVIYNDHQGGYIDNVPSTYTRQPTDGGGAMAPYVAAGGTSVFNNYSVAQNNWNPVDTQGARLSALWKINDNWNFLIAESYQNLDAKGQSSTYPVGSDGETLGTDQITAFVPGWNNDHYTNSAWTLNGQVGDLSLVYTGGYTNRRISEQQDYTNYSRSAGGMYYQCTGTSAGLSSAGKPICYSPAGYWNDTVGSTHQSHELRLSTPEDYRFRVTGGLYYEDFDIQDHMRFNYLTIPSCTPANLAGALAGGNPCVAVAESSPGVTLPAGTAFGENTDRGYKQEAAFGSMSYDIIPDVLTATVGTRYYHYSEWQTGTEFYTTTAQVNVPNGTYVGDDTVMNYHQTYHGFKSRANLEWHITPDMMVYYTFSQGFRPGGFNRTSSDVAKLDGEPQYKKPISYAPDTLTNNEIGFKSTFFNDRLLLNASAYDMRWDNVQMQFFNPLVLGNTTFAVNGPNYKVDGLEVQFQGKITEGLSIIGSGSLNHAKQTNSPCLVNNIPGSPGYNTCIVQTGAIGDVSSFTNPFGNVGSVPAFSPRSQYNMRLRYDWTFNGGFKAFAQAGFNRTGSMYNQPATYPSGAGVTDVTTVELRYLQGGYTTVDASIGVAKDNWDVSLYGTNLTDNHASVFTSSAQFIESEVPIRPRVLGVKVGFKF